MSLKMSPFEGFAEQESMRAFYGTMLDRIELEGSSEGPGFMAALGNVSLLFLEDDGTNYDIRICGGQADYTPTLEVIVTDDEFESHESYTVKMDDSHVYQGTIVRTEQDIDITYPLTEVALVALEAMLARARVNHEKTEIGSLLVDAGRCFMTLAEPAELTAYYGLVDELAGGVDSKRAISIAREVYQIRMTVLEREV